MQLIFRVRSATDIPRGGNEKVKKWAAGIVLCVLIVVAVIGIPWLGMGHPPWQRPVATSEPTVDLQAQIVAAVQTTLATVGPISATQTTAVVGTPGALIISSAGITTPTTVSRTMGSWSLEYFSGATAEMRSWVFPDLSPKDWPVFPDVTNTVGVKIYPASLEYGMAESTFCQYKNTCDFVVPSRHYRIYSGDYHLEGVDSCSSEGSRGCALMVVNVGEVTASFEDQTFISGFTVFGRYWDGRYLPQAVWAGLSHVSNNMLNMNSALNTNSFANAGANCSVPGGCASIWVTFAIISGNEVLLTGMTFVTR